MRSEKDKILNTNFWRQPLKQRQRVTLKDLRKLLLENEPVIAKGTLFDIKHKSVGAGIYEIWLEQRTYGAKEHLDD